MRYPPIRRLERPSQNDMRLWRVLDKLKLKHTKIAWIAQPGCSFRNNFFVAARLESGECFEWTGSFRTGGQSAKTKKQEKIKKEYMLTNNIPCLWLDRLIDEPSMELKIRLWLRNRKRKQNEN